MKCIIADPDKKTRQAVEKILKDSGKFTILASVSKAEEAIETVMKNPVDVIFIDMLMPGMDHMGFLSQLSYSRPHIIVMADKKEAAVDAFEFEATDFLLKPVNKVRLLKAIARIIKRDSKHPTLKNDNGTDLFLRLDGMMIRARMKDISYIEGMSDYVHVYVGDKKYTIFSTLKAILDHLPGKDFMRVQKSYIVRLDKIESIVDDIITIKNKEVPIGSTYKTELLNRLKIYPEMVNKSKEEGPGEKE
jgi:DNA-binding LytR/AlgR family response regulator